METLEKLRKKYDDINKKRNAIYKKLKNQNNKK